MSRPWLALATLRAGRGMGLALPAELNGYPGPVHVLELAGKLGLTEDQRKRVPELHAAMKAETVLLGERLIARDAPMRPTEVCTSWLHCSGSGPSRVSVRTAGT